MKVTFKILRQKLNFTPKFQSYTLDVNPSNTILECLNKIKWELDGSLTYRKNCRNTICGSCTMRINGRSALACKENIASELKNIDPPLGENPPEMIISPLNNLPVIKDLVVDMTNFWQDLETIEPYISTSSRNIPEKEFLQTPDQRKLLEQTGNCIMCGACYSDCNAKEVNPLFVGPHALAKSYRLVADSRDDDRENRLEKYDDQDSGVWGCTRCYLCNEVCPMDVAPLDQISKIKGAILAKKDLNSSRPIRHRKVLIDLVKQDGWIDERKFGVMVVGNYFRDVQGLLSIAPLGFRLLSSGKFPFHFQPSQGVKEVRSLISAVQKDHSVLNNIVVE
ncbi:succinate dehydrogenase/fumarate reductase iron-sulfur subunit [Geminocystis sp. GBBB08]|uniref:succinate dehydrogenase/fumarate reductase iron-sulfur subunit n=1 Tax=Geminocystis sp. GBBB08 TaxID=2604140 RepID=UPI0027E35508|nr:succinate dehydrogenase/fumarate reductase iron-sulfur subunit [Geminocystis sp. GBBB08]MBL1211573.1 succinate dehydrogenase/fumarate reductase iron-sulfur subunit [Geminocystis sp. GBBB08]